MMNVLQINSVINTGSTGRICEEIGNMLISQGNKSYIAFGRQEKFSNLTKIKIGNILDNIVHLISTRLFDNHGFASINATKKLIRKIKAISPDIIHIHNLHGYYINIEILFKFLQKENIPVVWTLHDCWAFTGHCSHFSFVGCEKWKTQCYNCPQTKEYPKSFFLDNSKKNFLIKKEYFTSLNNLTIVTVSDWLKSVAQQSYLSKYFVKRIYNGVDTSIFVPLDNNSLSKNKHISGKFVMLGVASVWSKRKGLNDYLSLSKLLHNDEVIVLIGLKKNIISKLPSNIIGIEKTENIFNLVEWYSISDVVLNLSVEETFGLTTVEGFACGTPSIVYNTTASPELITPKTGYIVERDESLKPLRGAIDNIKIRGKSFYKEACRKRSLEFFDKNNRYKEYLNLYQQLLKE